MFKKLKIKNDILLFNIAIYGIFLIVAGLVLPIILIPIVKITNYSEIVEEIAKALIVFFLILKLPSFKFKLAGAAVFGFLFGVSENFLYLNQIFQLGDFSIFWQRFLWTMPMHIITVLVMVFAGLARKRFLIFGLAGAIILHMLFNGIIIELLIR
ncbi:PrsW family intramembrane metalloprotease [Patescibacteria group bacterium]|nr:PrsW family intramembrane metalloprotease [Patescibacteria group bacterium]